MNKTYVIRYQPILTAKDLKKPIEWITLKHGKGKEMIKLFDNFVKNHPTYSVTIEPVRGKVSGDGE